MLYGIHQSRFGPWRTFFLAAVFLLAAMPADAWIPAEGPTFFAGNPSTRQLTFRYQVGLKALGWTEAATGVYGLFGQQSFWYLDNADRGYTVENNFAPEVMLLVDGAYLAGTVGWWPRNLHLGTSYSHHSNGIDGDLSRSWNHANLALFLGHPAQNQWSSTLKTWLPFNIEAGNEDIDRYMGHGMLALTWHPAQDEKGSGHTQISLATHFSFDHHSGGFFTNLETDLSFAPSWLGRAPFPAEDPRFAFFLQWFVGKGESLIEYRKHVNTVRLGLRLW